VPLFWVGLPEMRDERRAVAARAINRVLDEESGARAWVTYVDIWPLFVDEGGRFASYLPDEAGVVTHVRQPDGVHLTREGTNWVAARVFSLLSPGRLTLGEHTSRPVH
jgi:hypothetical protein